MAANDYNWTPQRVERLRELTTQKRSTNYIADELGTTRGSVAGKKKRLALSTPIPPPPPPRPRLVEVKSPPLTPPPPGSCTIVDLPYGCCKYPVNDPPRGGTIYFCGVLQMRGSDYCAEHTRLAYCPTPQKKEKTPYWMRTRC